MFVLDPLPHFSHKVNSQERTYGELTYQPGHSSPPGLVVLHVPYPPYLNVMHPASGRYTFGGNVLSCTTALSRKYTHLIMSGRPIRSPKQTAAILSYCAHRIRSTFRTTMSETFAKRTAHHVRSIRDTNVSNVRVSNEQM